MRVTFSIHDISPELLDFVTMLITRKIILIGHQEHRISHDFDIVTYLMRLLTIEHTALPVIRCLGLFENANKESNLSLIHLPTF